MNNSAASETPQNLPLVNFEDYFAILKRRKIAFEIWLMI